MRLKTDENLPCDVAYYLVQCGYDAVRVDEQGLAGVADPGVAAVCLVERRAIVTLDTDFMDIRRFPPEHYAGSLVLRPHRQTIPGGLNGARKTEASASNDLRRTFSPGSAPATDKDEGSRQGNIGAQSHSV